VFQSCSLGTPDGAVDLRAPLGGIRKRAFDIVITIVALIVLAPVLLALVGLLRLLTRKPVLVTDECIGFGGKAFARYQFSCAVDERADTDSAPRRLNDPSWAESLEDALRASGLDKLPLLFNVLRGDMSIIGPQPIRARQVSHYNGPMPEYLSTRPGITGLWRRTRQRKPRRESQRALNRCYVRYWSVWLDLGLLVESISRLAAMPRRA
jgi:exopolysaccharide production protein ExoY